MIVTRSAHEAALEQLVAQLDRRGLPESAGIHGPQSLAWQINAEVLNFLGAGRAILMQLAHPYVAYAIAEHSVALSDARRRFQNTFENIYQMVFGTRSEALASARTIHAVHARINGTIAEDAGRYRRGHRYHANESEALLWVHATLIHTAMQVHSVVGLRLSREQRSEFYADSKRFALLFGLDAHVVPADLEHFEHYVADKVQGDGLCVTAPAREIASFIMSAPTPALEPAFRLYRSVTAELLPRRLCQEYGLPSGRLNQRIAWTTLRGLAPVRSLMPTGFRLMPEALRAEERLGLRGASRLSKLMEGGMKRGLRLWS